MKFNMRLQATLCNTLVMYVGCAVEVFAKHAHDHSVLHAACMTRIEHATVLSEMHATVDQKKPV